MISLLSPCAAGRARKGLGLALLGALLPFAAVAKIEIISVEIESGTLRLVFADSAGEFNQFTLRQSGTLTGASWVELPGATWSPLDATRLLYSVPLESTDRSFFQIVGSLLGNALDPDGDGLPEALEILLGTDPARFDTDDDGFSDGIEYAYGTDPNNKALFPDFTLFPRAEFAAATSGATEGTAPFGVEVQFDRPYVGELQFRVLEQSTAKEGIDYAPLATTLAVDGPVAFIPLNWIDDEQISPDRLLFLEIVTADGLAYSRGGQTVHTIRLGENDAWWSGVLSTDFQQRNFRLKIIQRNGSTSATFAAGPGQDGLAVLEDATAEIRSDQSSGVVPVGTFPATVEASSESHFRVISPPMLAPTSGLLGPGTGLTRTLTLEALPAANGLTAGHEISPARVIGSYHEALCLPNGTVCAEQEGVLVLVRQLPARPSVVQ